MGRVHSAETSFKNVVLGASSLFVSGHGVQSLSAERRFVDERRSLNVQSGVAHLIQSSLENE